MVKICFRPVVVKKDDGPVVRVKIENLTSIVGPPRQIKVTVKNIGSISCTMLDKCVVSLPVEWEETEVQTEWSSASLQPGETSTGIMNYEWKSGKTYYVKVLTKEGPSERLAMNTL